MPLLLHVFNLCTVHCFHNLIYLERQRDYKWVRETITALHFVAMIQNTEFVVLLSINVTNAFPVRCIIIFCFVFWLCSLFSKLRTQRGKSRHEESCYGVKVFVLWRGDSGFNAQPPAAKQLPLCGASGVTGRSQCCHTRSSRPLGPYYRPAPDISPNKECSWLMLTIGATFVLDFIQI